LAGYILNTKTGDAKEFHIHEEELDLKIRLGSTSPRVAILQLDGDELKAVIWGLKNYRKT
jgi:hypothetical protein